ncbi:MAG: toll/interleukin-1 receptor domain-containing protein [Ginsengibacter sp.]
MVLKKIFFSYSRADGSAFALRLALDLKKEGFNVWIDQEDIRAGSEWDMEIEKALETCDCLLFIETAKSVTSNNVLDEVYYALEEHKKVIPLILVDSKTPFRLQRLQHIDFTKNYHAGLVLLVNELKGNIPTESFPPEEERTIVVADNSFYKKHTGLLFVIAALVILVAVIIVYFLNNNRSKEPEKARIENTTNTIEEDKKPADDKSNEASTKNVVEPEPLQQKKTANESRGKKLTEKTNNITANTGDKAGNLPEDFAGDWQLAGVEPKAQSTNGFLKIEQIDEKKVSIKSSLQFYYYKTNDTSFLSVFNAFVSCSSCSLEKDMKLTAEDVAIGSHSYTILKNDQPGKGKAGDTIMNAGANKSIRASVTLHLIDNKTVLIKIQRPVVTELSGGLILQPFLYSFRFTKVD